MTEPRPEAPDGLSEAGLALWNGVLDCYDLRVDELRILEDASFEADLINRLESAMASAPLTVTGSMGQLVSHPLVQELRQHRATLANLLKSLKLADALGGSVGGNVTPMNRQEVSKLGNKARWEGRYGGGA